MIDWDLSPPASPSIGDHDVPAAGTHLLGKRIALLVSGGIAAMKAPLIARGLRRQGARVTAFASDEALRYTTTDALEWATTNPVVTRLGARAEHLSDAEPFDVYLVAPATYNTINKMRHGIADGVVTATLASALGRMERGTARVLVAPTMHGTMHNSILTESLVALRRMGVTLVRPRDAYGKHNLPDTPDLVAAVCRAQSRSPLVGVPVLVTGGTTPVPIDGVRRITNRFRGRLGIAIAEELHLRGADVLLIHGDGAVRPPGYVPHQIARTYDDYRAQVASALAARSYRHGIFSAAVADYRPETVFPGKIPSGGALASLALVPTVKVIDEVQREHPSLSLISFKYQERLSHEALMEIARDRLGRGHAAVVANRGEEAGPDGEHIAHLLVPGQPERRLAGKPAIARELATLLEGLEQRAVAAG
jgi:phosphopantothenoylcysteine decarboxylase/phosphopantothenate--cysteine ligase